MKTSTKNKSDTGVTKEQLWYELEVCQHRLAHERITSFFDRDPQRQQNYSIHAAGLLLDYSKNLLDEQALELLVKLAENCQLKTRIDALFNGEEVNNTEHRPALHTALRNQGKTLDKNLRDEVNATSRQMENFVRQLHTQSWLGNTGKPITDVVNIGIGGSDLGPVMVTRALTPYAQDKVKVHFVSNIDGTHLSEQLKHLDPHTTLFIVASKSFNTIETRKNAEAARNWCYATGISTTDICKHFIAVSTNIQAAVEFGIDEDNIFPMWDWVGGRYSLWSAIGLPIAISIGMDNFKAMLHGAYEMDYHFQHAGLNQNMPVILGLLSIWYINFFNAQSQIVIPYDHYLHKFPSFLQQLAMESNGKSVHRDGSPVNYNTMGAIFGEAGSNTQHSFHQLLHQGTHLFPVDFILPATSHNPLGDQHAHLYANCLSQSQALMCGRSLEQVIDELNQQGYSQEQIDELAPHKVIPGNKPSNTIVMHKLTPATLGALIALYEHKVFVESIIWDIDAFDQWGVELGKVLSNDIYQVLADANSDKTFDPSTQGLINYYMQYNKT